MIMKKQYSKIFALLGVVFCLNSCTIHPFVLTNKHTNTQIVSLGGSLLSKKTTESGFLDNGMVKMEYNMHGKSETLVPNTLMGILTAIGDMVMP